MNSFKMKDLLVCLQPGNGMPERHFQQTVKCQQPSKSAPEMEFGKCAQPSKAVPWKVLLEGPTKAAAAQADALKEAPCPCPSKATDEAAHAKNALQSTGYLSHPHTSGASALADLKKALAHMQAKTESIH